MKISNLTQTTSLAASDLFPVQSTAQGLQSVTLTTLADAVADLLPASSNPETQYSSPVTGASVAVVPVVAGSSVWLLVTPLGTLAALTLVLPGDGSTGGAAAVDGQEAAINCTQTITTLTVSSVGKTVVGAPTTFGVSTPFRMRYNAVNNSWYRVV